MDYEVWDWETLRQELDAWAAAERIATLWWRDDDMAGPCDGLSRLLALSAAHAVPVALAAIPAAVEPVAARQVARHPLATVLQHGYAHIDHAPDGEGCWELGAHRPRAVVCGELARGRDRLAELFGDRFLPVLTPPWSRIDPALLPELEGLGFTGLSGFWPRDGRAPLPEVNAHVAVSDWKPEARFAGAENVIYDLLLHLWQRRTGAADPDEPTGISTHHRIEMPAAWTFLDRLFGFCNDHPAVAWTGIRAAIDAARQAAGAGRTESAA